MSTGQIIVMIHLKIKAGFRVGQWLCPSINPSMLLKEKFRVSVSCQEPSGMGQKEERI